MEENEVQDIMSETKSSKGVGIMSEHEEKGRKQNSTEGEIHEIFDRANKMPKKHFPFWGILIIIAVVFFLAACVGPRKPVIYLYPEERTDVTVKLDFNGKLTYTYPEYADGREYSYLFWEGDSNIDFDFSKGFVVKGSDTVAFLQEKLAYMGLTPREYNEFIVYWLPEMQDNPYNLIAFQGAAYTDNAKLTITPEPDSVRRVFMAFKPLGYPIDIQLQELRTFERKGFTVVEWGGSVVR